MPSWPMIEYQAETWCLLVTHISFHVRLVLLRIPSPTFGLCIIIIIIIIIKSIDYLFKTLFLETGGVIQDSILPKIGHRTMVIGNALCWVFRPCTDSHDYASTILSGRILPRLYRPFNEEDAVPKLSLKALAN
jgi:hypothetical protein